MSVINWLRSQLGRINESKWTKFFILTSVTQLLVVVALESRVLNRNINLRNYIAEGVHGCNNLTASKDRMSLIITENAAFMIFQAFQLWFCLNAVVKQNTIQIFTFTIINFLCGFFGIVQIFEIIKWTKDLTAACPGISGIQRQFMTVDAPLVAVLVLFSLVTAVIGFKLYQQFGWNIYKKIGADIKIQKIYKTMLIFVMLLKLDLFFVLLLSVEVFFAFSEEGKNNDSFTFMLPGAIYKFHLFVTILIFFLELLAYRSVQKEWKKGMMVFITLSTIVIIDFILVLRSATDTIENSWYFFVVFITIAIILCSVTWVFAVLVLRNFDRGLLTILGKNTNKLDDNNSPGVGSSTQARNDEEKFIID